MMNTKKMANAIASIALVGAALLTSGPARAVCNAWTSVTASTYGHPQYQTATCTSGSYNESAYFAAGLGTYAGVNAIVSYAESNGARGYYVDNWLWCPYDGPQGTGAWHEYGVAGPYHSAGNSPPVAPPSQVVYCDNSSPAGQDQAYVYVW
jgi:hypothetical protein